MAIYTGSNKHLGGTEDVDQKQTFYYGLVQKHVLVTGAKGQLGQALAAFVKGRNLPFRFYFADSQELDIRHREAVMEYVAKRDIDFIINAAAYTAVDRAEEERELAYAVNEQGAAHLAQAAAEVGAKLIHISTDYVFDGKDERPYLETDEVAPMSVYGSSKLKGEEAVQRYAHEWAIVRTAWLFAEYGNNFVKTMIRLMSEREVLTVVDDQRGTPTYAVDLAEMLVEMMDAAEWKSGVYHFTNRGETTWFGFARRIQELKGLHDCEVRPISSAEYPTAAMRPAYSVLDTGRIESDFGVVIPQWEDALERCLNNL